MECRACTTGKDLGVLTSCDLSTSYQCTEAASKASRVLGMVRTQFKVLDKESFLIIYKGFIRPHLEYAIQAWSPYAEISTAWKKFKEERPRWWMDFAITGSAVALHCCKAHERLNRKTGNSTPCKS